MKCFKFLLSFFMGFIGCSFLFVASVLAESWHFSSNLEGWAGRNCYIKHSPDEDGRLYMHPEGNDPGIVCSVNFRASDNNLLKMFIWTDCSNKNLTLYFRSNNGSIKTGPSITLSRGMNGNEYSIDLSSFSNWTNTITELRIDPSDSCGSSGNSGFIAFDYIKTDYKIVYGSISGGARDYYTENPLENVAVRLEVNNDIITKSVYTRSNGTYQINNVIPGTYNLVAIKEGYDNFLKTGKIIKGNQNLSEQNIAMKPKKPELSSFSLDNGASQTKKRNVSLNFSKNYSATHYKVSESSSFIGAIWKSYSSSPNFNLSSGFGTKKVYFKLKNNSGESNTRSDSITYVPTPQISASKTDMIVNETITLKCHLGSEDAGRRITFFVDPGGARLRTYSESTDRYGVASFPISAEEDWVPKTFFACRDDYTGEVSKYDANVSVSKNYPPEVSISLKENEIAHGWHVEVDISSDDPDNDNYSCRYKINSGSWINTIKNGTLTIKPPHYSFIIGTNTITVACTDEYGTMRSDDATLTDYAVPGQAPNLLSPDEKDIDIQSSYKFTFAGFPDPASDQKYHYKVIIDDNSNFSSPFFSAEIPGSPFYIGDDKLKPGNTYYWRIRAENSKIAQGPWADAWFKIVSPIATGALSGTIYCNDNKPLAHATIFLKKDGNIRYSPVYSDSNGKYSFTEVAPDLYNLCCYANYYVSQTNSVSIIEDNDIHMDILMIPSEINWKTESQQIDESVKTVTFAAFVNGLYIDDIRASFTVSGSATNGSDYDLSNGTFLFENGETVLSKTFEIIDDNLKEPEENIVIRLESPVNAVIGFKSTHTVTILPSDSGENEPDPIPYLSFSDISSPQIVGEMFDVDISLYNHSGNLVDSNCEVLLWATHSSKITPGRVFLNNGKWMGKVSILEAGSNIHIEAKTPCAEYEYTGKSKQFTINNIDNVGDIVNNTGRIEGKITSTNGFFNGKAFVHLSKEKYGKDLYFTEAVNSKYSIENIECGTYFIYGSHGSYGENTSVPYPVKIPCDRTVTKDITEDLFISFCNQNDKIPILLVPGIMGSSTTNFGYPTLPKYSPSWDSNELSLYDPFNLVGWVHLKNYLIENYQYKEGCTLFDVPYDWRMDINKSAEAYLKKWIDHAKKIAGTDKVHIIAHSMGGLLARAYIQNKDIYDQDVARLALVGTPNHGAGLAYYLWEGGDPGIADKVSSMLSKKLRFYTWTTNLMYQTIYDELILLPELKYKLSSKYFTSFSLKLPFNQDHAKTAWTLIHKHAPSIRQLLPVYDFALSYNGKESNISKCHNRFLTDLNNDPDILTMVAYSDDVTSYDNDKVITKLFAGYEKETIKTIKVESPPELSSFYTPEVIEEICYKPVSSIKDHFFYPDGIPVLSPEKFATGDETVLFDSVKIHYSNGNETLNLSPEAKKASHSCLIKDFRNEIAAFITQDNEWNLFKRQKDVESNTPDSHIAMAVSLGILGRAQPYIVNPSSLGAGINPFTQNREDKIPESHIEITSDTSNIILESPEHGLYSVFIKGIYEEDYYLFLSFLSDEETDTLSYHVFNQAQTTLLTFYLDSDGVTVTQSLDVTIAVSAEKMYSSGKTKLSWTVNDISDVESFNIYSKKSGQSFFSKISNTQDLFFVTNDEWVENENDETLLYAVSAIDDHGNESFLSPFVRNKRSISCTPQSDCQEESTDHTIIFESFEESSLGKSSGITYTNTSNGMGAVFTRENESRVEYPFSMGLPRQGTIEFLIKIHHGYNYSKYELADNLAGAIFFDSGKQDVWWKGAMWFSANDEGTISLHTATVNAQPSSHVLVAESTNFKFHQWHSLGFSYGSEGQHIMLDGKIVASNEEYTESLSSCGNFDRPVNSLTLGEVKSCFWNNNQYDKGFDGIVDFFRASEKQQNWLITKNEDILVPDFRSDKQTGNTPLNIQFTDLSTGDITQWKWDFDGDGIIDSQEQNPQFSYSDSGSYSVFLSISNDRKTITKIKSDYITVSKPEINPPVQITFTGDLYTPVWSPDGNTIGFKRGSSDRPANVWTMNTDGTNAIQISNMPSHRKAWGPTFRPGTEFFYYMDNSPTGADWWWFIKTSYDGSLGRNEVTKLVPGGHGNSPPRFSSDGNKIAFIHIAYLQNNITHLYIKYRNADGSNEHTVLSDDNILMREVYWGKGVSSDKLFYNKKEDDVISIFMISSDGTGETKITDKEFGNCYLSDCSPDGKKVLLIKDHQVFYINLDGTNLTQLTNDPYINSSPCYSQDGTKFVYVSKRSDKRNLFINSVQTLPVSHFQSVWQGNPIDSMKIWIIADSFEKLNLSIGDEIAVFDGNICVGSSIIQSLSDKTLNILTSKNDSADPGFTEGHKISFRIWDASEQLEYKNVAGDFFLLDGNPTDNTFKPNADSAVSLYINTVEQTFQLKTGWNTISFYVIPEQTDMIDLVKPLIDSQSLFKIIDEKGHRLIFNIFSNKWENEISEMDNEEGYLIKVRNDVEFNIKGEKVALPYEINLVKGWNIFGWPADTAQNAMNIVNSLIDNNSLIKVIDEQGHRIIYNVFANDWVDEIVNFNPGKGFLIKVSRDSSLKIDQNLQEKKSDLKSEILKNRTLRNNTHFTPIWNGYPYNSLKLWLVGVNGFVVDEKDEIGIFDKDQCVGAAILQNEISFENIVKIICSQNDGDENGFTVGHEIQFRIWDHSEKKEIKNISAEFMDMSTAEVFNPSPAYIGNNDYGVKLKIEKSQNDEKIDLAEVIYMMQCLSGKRHGFEKISVSNVVDYLQMLSRIEHIKK